MGNREFSWEILNKIKKHKSPKQNKLATGQAKSKNQDIIDILLENRGLKTRKEKEEFFNPEKPQNIPLQSIGIKKNDVKKAIKRIAKAKESGEKVVVFGDYDADGICAAAILWEALYSLGIDSTPYIPNRFDEGYGIKKESVNSLKAQYPNLGLIITVDNGIVANEAVIQANKLSIDVIITDHHQSGEKLPDAYCTLHTTEIGGAGISWFLVREIEKNIKSQKLNRKHDGLELAAIGTIADQIPLLGTNRSIVKHGIVALNETERLGLLSLVKKAGIEKRKIGTYEVGFIVAPRLNAMGRMEHAIDSLRLLCTKNIIKAERLANLLNKTNLERQKVVDEVIFHAREQVESFSEQSILVLAHESYHEGVIGLAASKLVEEYYRPTIVFSKGNPISKASARSISGFNIIETINKLDDILEEGGGHPMAAGFSIISENIGIFIERINEVAKPLLTSEILSRKLKIDMGLDFDSITENLVKKLEEFEPTGLGNPRPSFFTESVEVVDVRTVGREYKHLKMKVLKGGKVFDSIAFGMGNKLKEILSENIVDIAYSLEFNIWNGSKEIQLKIKDMHISEKK